jgi:hypothetical protein
VRAAHADTRLEAIAGAPVAVRTQAGSAATGLAPMQDRTLVAVVEVTEASLSDPWYVFARVGALTQVNGYVSLRTQAANTDQLGEVVRAAGNPNESGLGYPGYRTVGRHVMTLRVSDGFSRVRSSVDESGVNSRTVSPYGGILDGVLYASPRTTVAAVWGRALSDGEVARVCAWLKWRYQA